MFTEPARLTPARRALAALVGRRRTTRAAKRSDSRDQARMELEERFRATFEQSAVGIMHATINGTLVRVNNRMAEMLGYEPEELCGLHARDITHPDDVVIYGDLVRRGLANRPSMSVEKRYLRRDGQSVWVLLTLSLAQGSRDSEPYVIAVVQDITSRKSDEAALRRSEERLRNVMEQASDGIFIADESLRITQVNARGCELAGRTPEEVLSSTISDLLLPDPGQPLRLEQARAGGRILSERYALRGDGTVTPVEISARMLRDGKYLALVRDVSERKLAEQKLRETEERFRQLVEHGHDLVAVVDADWVCRFVTRPVTRLFGYTPEELVGRSLLEYVHPEDVEAVCDVVRDLLGGAPPRLFECRCRASDGSWRWMETIGTNLLDHPAVGGIVLNARDVTQHRVWKSQLEQAERMASIGRLAAMMAHEFNNVLMGIQPFAEMIRRADSRDERLRTASAQIETSIQRGKRVTEEILRFTRDTEPALLPMDLAAWIREIRMEMEALVGDAAELRFVLPERGALVVGDRAQLTQMLSNLLVNARDAMPAGGAITVSVDPQAAPAALDLVDTSRFVQLVVRDEGTGMDEQTRLRIFEPLFTTKRNGNGLGLAMAHRTIVKHGGRIFVQSAPGEGSTFRILLPRSERAPELAGEQATDRTDPRRERPVATRVLLVEDEPAIADGLCDILESEGFSVCIAGSGSEAISAAGRILPDLVVLDIGLPDMDGSEVFARLTAARPALPVIFSSGHGDASRLPSRPGSRTRFLQKPYGTEVLLRAAAEILATDPA